MRYLITALASLFALSLGAAGTFLLLRPKPTPLPDGPTVVQRVQATARLETLELSLYKKVDFSPEPPPSDSLWKNLANWARHSLHTPRGRAIIFARAQLGYDLKRLDHTRLRVEGTRVEVALPPPEIQVELLPGEMEVIGSNLDSEQTAQLLEHAKDAFLREVHGDVRLRERAQRSAEDSLRALLLPLGFQEVRFLDALPQHPPG